jgi:phytoene dehydrogenase-like protein
MIEGKEHSFDAIVSTLLVQNLFTIADEKHFPKEYVKMMKSLQGTGSLCAYYSLKNVDTQLLGKTFHFIERDIGVDGNDAVGMIDFMSAVPDTGLSPPSHHLVQSYIICTPKEARDKKTLDILKIALDKNLERLIPNFNSQLRWAIYPAVWHLDGVAKTTDNTKPEIQTPVKNLFVIGDCVKAPGIGINCAINSARVLQEILTDSV